MGADQSGLTGRAMIKLSLVGQLKSGSLFSRLALMLYAAFRRLSRFLIERRLPKRFFSAQAHRKLAV